MTASSPLHRYHPGRPHWWQWLTVLSLDAPLVALAWQAVLARAAATELSWSHRYILGAAVWLAYAADRWLEGWRLAPDRVRTQRHWFYQRWRWPVAALWLVALATALQQSWTRLTGGELTAGLWLLAPVLLYLLSHQAIHREQPWRAPKEICVALLLAAGAACFPAADHRTVLVDLAGPLLLFGLLCFADCSLISLWEREVDRTHGQTSLTLQFPRSRPFVRGLPWAIAVLGVGFALHTPTEAGGAGWCAAASGALLGALDLVHHRLGRQLSRALVDLPLLTPFIWQIAAGRWPWL